MMQLCVTAFIVQFGLVVSIEEPTCLSRFDYDYKMLTKMVDLETQYKLDKDASEKQIQVLMEKIDDMTSLLHKYKQNQDDSGNLLIIYMLTFYEIMCYICYT